MPVERSPTRTGTPEPTTAPSKAIKPATLSLEDEFELVAYKAKAETIDLPEATREQWLDKQQRKNLQKQLQLQLTERKQQRKKQIQQQQQSLPDGDGDSLNGETSDGEVSNYGNNSKTQTTLRKAARKAYNSDNDVKTMPRKGRYHNSDSEEATP